MQLKNIFRKKELLKNNSSPEKVRGKLSKLFFWLFLVSLPFGCRVLLFKFTPGFDEYEAIFLYASDVFMVLFLFCFLLNRIQAKFVFKNRDQDFRNCLSEPEYPAHKEALCAGFLFHGAEIPTSSGTKLSAPAGYSSRQQWKSCLIWLFVLFLFISIFFASYKLLALFNFIRLVLLVLTALAIAESLKRNWIKLETILAVLAGSAVFQSFIAFFQFLNQKSLGLRFLGESVLGPGISGVAKIVVAGGKILRAYGTFPHPNILAAFLLLGLFSSYYFLSQSNFSGKKFFIKISIVLAVFLINLGLVLTFSRTAWLLGLILSLAYVFLSRIDLRQKTYIILILIFIFLIIFLAMSWLIFPRAEISLTEQSVSQRISYNKLGLYLLNKNSLGVGLGNQVIYSVKNGLYQIFGMNQVWQWQPIHNIYLLIGSEIGVLGLIVFLIFIAGLLINTVRFLIKNKNSEISNLLLIVGFMFLSLLGFSLFDHFLWTLQPGRLMLWLVLGIILGVRPYTCPPATDRQDSTG